ncbi:MAG TPA: UvrD-helicase domain-containing protein [Myxococcaceae bacterium]|nr:UvrD-helicase domain-containing protein [Myxococcaceae bacterium]
MDLSGLNPPQRRAVTTTEGPLLVLAGAGSGKTRVITQRIAWLLDQGVSPRAILAVTFTNKAAREMKERVARLVGQGAQALTICTFHAFGAEVLRQHVHRLGWPRKFAIADVPDQISLVQRALRERSIDGKADFDPRRILTAISRAKNAGRAPGLEGDAPGDGEIAAAEVFPLYQRALKAQGAVDFDDLLLLPLRVFQEHPDVLGGYVRRFRYLLVDEFQDTNAAQLELVRRLAGERRNVCAVGDDDQCIYGWRGAEVRNVLRFEEAFPGATEVRLEQNYRSVPAVLEAAHGVVSQLPERRAKKLWTATVGGPRVQLAVVPGEDDEAAYVARCIEQRLARGFRPDDIAVLYRTNGQSRPFEEAFRARGIGYQVLGGTEFFDRREVRDVLAYLKVLANPADEISLLRIVNVPPRGIGDVTVEHLVAHARGHGLPLGEVLASPAPVPELTPGSARAVREFSELIQRTRARLRAEPLSTVARALLADIGFEAAARASAPSAAAAERRRQGVEGLLGSLEQFERREGPSSDLLTYLNRLSLDSREEEDGPAPARVTLLTLHGAKGLEFRTVFLVGMEEGFLPHGGMQGESQNLEEERRLCYVGITRARQELILTRAAARLRRGREVPRTPSRFLADIPESVLEVSDTTVPPPGPPGEAEQGFFRTLKARLQGGSPPPSA